VGDLARRQIVALTDSALRNAGVTGIIPTPLDVVAKAAGITEIVDISRLPRDIEARKPPALKRILGALLHRERVALVDRSQPEPRARLTEAHEIGHQIIPWHQAAFQLDDEERLLGRTRDQLEREAYLAGGHLIFQGEHFWGRALDYQVSIGTPVALAPEYGATSCTTPTPSLYWWQAGIRTAPAASPCGRALTRRPSWPGSACWLTAWRAT
jgi:hypothetical protein